MARAGWGWEKWLGGRVAFQPGHLGRHVTKGGGGVAGVVGLVASCCSDGCQVGVRRQEVLWLLWQHGLCGRSCGRGGQCHGGIAELSLAHYFIPLGLPFGLLPCPCCIPHCLSPGSPFAAGGGLSAWGSHLKRNGGVCEKLSWWLMMGC